jgi:hypothetical protein
LTPDALWGTAPGKLEAAAALAGHSGRELRVAGMRDTAALFRRRRTLLEVNRQRFRSALRTLASAGVSQATRSGAALHQRAAKSAPRPNDSGWHRARLQRPRRPATSRPVRPPPLRRAAGGCLRSASVLGSRNGSAHAPKRSPAAACARCATRVVTHEAMRNEQ